MMKRKNWWTSPAGLTAIVAVLIGAYMGYLLLERGVPTYRGWPHPMLLGWAGTIATAIGLWLRKEWSRWLAIGTLVFIVGMSFLNQWPNVLDWQALLRLLGLAYGCWHFWWLPITRVQEIVSDPELVTEIRKRAEKFRPQLRAFPKWEVVVLQKAPQTLAADALADCASRAFGHKFRVFDKEISPLDGTFLPTEYDEPIVAGSPPILLCVEPPHLLGVFSLPGSYISNWAGGGLFEQAQLGDLVLPPHDSFVAVAMLPSVNRTEPVANGSRWTCRLAASLIDTSTVAVIVPDKRKVIAASPAIRTVFLADDPYAAIDASDET